MTDGKLLGFLAGGVGRGDCGGWVTGVYGGVGGGQRIIKKQCLSCNHYVNNTV